MYKVTPTALEHTPTLGHTSTTLGHTPTTLGHLQHNKINNLISADYSVDMTEIIGKRPIYTVRNTEYQIPKMLTVNIFNNKVDATCKTPVWKNNCI